MGSFINWDIFWILKANQWDRSTRFFACVFIVFKEILVYCGYKILKD